MKKKRSFKIAGKLIGGLILLLGILFVVGKLFLDPYRGTIRTWSSSPSKPLDYLLSSEEAREDISFLMNKLKERHPAFLDGIPKAVQEQYDKEMDGINGEISVLHLWQASARILSKLKDGHTNIGYQTKEPYRLPLNFHYEDGVLSCMDDSFQEFTVSKINGLSWENLYQTYKEQFSYELESYALYRFAQKLPYKTFLAFIGLDPSNPITLTILTEKGEEEVTYSFALEEISDQESDDIPFVSYTIDQEKSLGIFTLLSCDNTPYYRDTVKQFFTEVKENDIQYIAVDLRDNPGGNSSVADEFIRYLNIEKYYITGGCDIRYGPFLKKYSKSITKNKQIEDLVFKGKTYVLTSTQTFSSAMMFATILSDNQIGEIIGEIPGNMPSSYGDILYFQTPNAKLDFTVSYKYFRRIDDSKLNLPLIPDYEVDANNAIHQLYEIIHQKES